VKARYTSGAVAVAYPACEAAAANGGWPACPAAGRTTRPAVDRIVGNGAAGSNRQLRAGDRSGRHRGYAAAQFPAKRHHRKHPFEK